MSHLMRIRQNYIRLVIIAMVCLLFSVTTTPVSAGRLTPSIQDIYILQDADFSSSIFYTNTTDQTITLKPSVLPYDAKEEKVLDVKKSKVLVSTTNREYIVAPDQTVEIGYKISVSKNIKPASYFNVIALIEQNDVNVQDKKSTDGSIEFDIQKGEGSLIAIHVSDRGQVLGAQDLEVSLKPTRSWYLPVIFPAQAELTVTNNTGYAIELRGEMRVVTATGRVLATESINPNGAKLYSGDSMSQVIANTSPSLEDVSLVYRLSENLTDEYRQGSVTVVNYSWYVIAALFLFIALFLVRWVKPQLRSTSNNKNPVTLPSGD